MAPTRKVTFCRICEASCGLIAEVEGEQVLRLLPDPDHVVSKGFLCVKGVRYTELHHSPDRLLSPLKRVGDRFEPISWAQALSEIGAKVQALRTAHGSDSIGMYIGNPSAFSVPHILLASMFIEAIGTPHLYTPGSQDCNNKFVVAEELYGSPMLQPIPDVDHARCVIMVGTNPAVSQLTFANTPRLMERLKAVEKAGGHVAFVNPRKTESAQQVGQQLFIRPGSDVFFFLAFAHLVLEARPALAAGVRDKVIGYDDVRALVAPWTPERVADVTGIAAADLRALAARYLAADGAVLYAGTGVNQGQHGTLCAWLLHVITLASGNLDRAGGMLVTPQIVRASKLGPHGKALADKRTFSRIGGHRSVLGSWPAGILADEILTPGKGQLRAMFVTAGNPLLSLANSERVRDAMEQLELLVCVDLFRNETGNLAHYVLPATSSLERTDVPMGMGGYQPVPYAQMVEPVVPPRGESRDEWWIFAQLARACGAPIFGSKALTRWMSLGDDSKLPRVLRFRPELLYAILAGFEKLTLGKLRKNPHGVLLPRYAGGKFFTRGVLHADGKVKLAPAAFVEAAAGLDAAHEAMLAASRQPGGVLRLITKREKTSHNSWMHNVEAFVSGPRGTNYLFMHPDDAAARGLKSGDACEVRTDTGALCVPVKITDELMPGTVALPHGWGHQRAEGLRVAVRTRGMNANVLAPDGSASLEKLAGMTHLTALEVRVAPAS
ncbi:MAG: molybdopterin-dependent oxidoreductase [Polyangiales bacterium]